MQVCPRYKYERELDTDFVGCKIDINFDCTLLTVNYFAKKMNGNDKGFNFEAQIYSNQSDLRRFVKFEVCVGQLMSAQLCVVVSGCVIWAITFRLLETKQTAC